MVIIGRNAKEIDKLKRQLFQEFEMKDLGKLKYFLRLEALRSKKRDIYQSKERYLDLLAKVVMMDYKPADSPMVTNHGLQIIEGAEKANQERYRRIVVKLIY